MIVDYSRNNYTHVILFLFNHIKQLTFVFWFFVCLFNMYIMLSMSGLVAYIHCVGVNKSN